MPSVTFVVVVLFAATAALPSPTSSFDGDWCWCWCWCWCCCGCGWDWDDDDVPWSHIFGEIGAIRSGDDAFVSANDSPSLLHLESTFLLFNFRSWNRLILSSSLYGPRLSVIIPIVGAHNEDEKKRRNRIIISEPSLLVLVALFGWMYHVQMNWFRERKKKKKTMTNFGSFSTNWHLIDTLLAENCSLLSN